MAAGFQYSCSPLLLSPSVLVLFLWPALLHGAVIVTGSESVQIGTPVTEPGKNNRHLLQFDCPANMILQDGQCVCAQNYFSSASVIKVTVDGTEKICSGLNQATSLARSCTNPVACPLFTSANPQNAWFELNVPINQTTDGKDTTVWYQNALPRGVKYWLAVDFQTVRVVGGGRIKGNSWHVEAYPMLGNYEIWVGNSPSTYNAAGNVMCFRSTSDTSLKVPPFVSMFSCDPVVAGRYLFVTRVNDNLISEFNQIGLQELTLYSPQTCMDVTSCLACPAGTRSMPGSLLRSDCFMYNALQVNFTVDEVDQDMNQSSFVEGLPAGIADLIYDDQVVVYVETCPTGYFCVSDTTMPASCPAGTFRDTPGAEALTDCLICPVGYYCPIATTNPTKCAAGTYRGSTGAKQPTDCAACISGNYCILGSVDPVNCTAGTYRATTGAQGLVDCLVCPVGQFCGIATTTPTPCAAGTYRGGTSGVTQDDCLVCPLGFYCPQQSVTPTQCPAGTYGNQTSASLLSQCKTCLVGYYCPIASIVPTACAAGTYRGTIGAIEQADCSACPTGHYCPESSVAPIDCPLGTYFNDTHGTQDTNCQPCEPGTYCPVASTLPTSCPAGYFRDSAGGSQLSSCYICPSGQFCPERTVVPTSCLPGTYRATSGASQISDCLPCPAGQYCPFATTVPVSCPAGSYRGTSGGDDRFSCTACPTGNYCPEQSVNPVNCSAGTYRPVPGAGVVAECIPCPTGEYCPLATTTPTPCPSGTYRGVEGASIAGDCLVCPVGKYCPIQTTTPQNCAPGSFRETTGAHQQSDCSVCPTGNYCPEMSTTPIDCPITTHRATVGATSFPDCVPCPAGLYCPTETTTPIPCAAGTYRAVQSAGAQTDCPPCPSGSYCPIQTITPIKCRAGTRRESPGATQLSNCLLCQPGTYSLLVGRTTNCPLCDTNFYCRTSTSKDVCPLHTTSSAGSYSRVNCLCDPGYQCTYYKQIQAIVTLNATLWEFNNDINGVRTAFIAAMAAAAGVHTSFVTINEVMTQGGRRRALLSVESGTEGVRETINVHASVSGAVKLRDLDKHLGRHSSTLHIAHRWEQAPQIHAVAIQGAAVPGLRRLGMAPAKAGKWQVKTDPVVKQEVPKAVVDERIVARERVKARSIKLVNKDFLMGMLNQV